MLEACTAAVLVGVMRLDSWAAFPMVPCDVVCEFCRLAVVCVCCRCSLSFVFLSVSRRFGFWCGQGVSGHAPSRCFTWGARAVGDGWKPTCASHVL